MKRLAALALLPSLALLAPSPAAADASTPEAASARFGAWADRCAALLLRAVASKSARSNIDVDPHPEVRWRQLTVSDNDGIDVSILWTSWGDKLPDHGWHSESTRSWLAVYSLSRTHGDYLAGITMSYYPDAAALARRSAPIKAAAERCMELK